MMIKKDLSVNENGFVFDPVTGESYTLNPVGLEMLQLLQLGQPKEEIKQHYLNHYELDEWGFEKAFLDFMALLGKYQLLEHE